LNRWDCNYGQDVQDYQDEIDSILLILKILTLAFRRVYTAYMLDRLGRFAPLREAALAVH
jgi:hypothetical protein